jgi:hypothetical protein
MDFNTVAKLSRFKDSGTTIQTGKLVAKLSNHRFKYLDSAT